MSSFFHFEETVVWKGKELVQVHRARAGRTDWSALLPLLTGQCRFQLALSPKQPLYPFEMVHWSVFLFSWVRTCAEDGTDVSSHREII